jgi:hypothetical protein
MPLFYRIYLAVAAHVLTCTYMVLAFMRSTGMLINKNVKTLVFSGVTAISGLLGNLPL